MVLDTLTEQAKVDPVNNDDCLDNQTDQLNKLKSELEDWKSFENALVRVLSEYKKEHALNRSLQNTVKQLKGQITKLKNESK